MLSIRSQEKIIQRVVKTKTGQFVLATFLVIEQNGQFNVRLLAARPVADGFKINDSGFTNKAEELESTSSTLSLPGVSHISPAITFYRHNYSGEVSPFFDQLKFFISQPTRAPSFSL